MSENSTNTTEIPGGHALPRAKSVREIQHDSPRKRELPRMPRPKLSEKQRAYLLSPEHIANLAANVAKFRAMNGGKAATRKGVPGGWGGIANRKLRTRILEEAAQKAQVAVEALVEHGRVRLEPAGEAALAFVVSVILARDPESGRHAYTVGDRLKAARIILEFCMEAPRVSRGQAIQSAEDYLLGLLF